MACNDPSPLQVNVKVKSAFNNKLFALNVVVNIPVPDNTAKADIQTSQGQLLATSNLPARGCCYEALGSYYSLSRYILGKGCVQVTHDAMASTLLHYLHSKIPTLLGL